MLGSGGGGAGQQELWNSLVDRDRTAVESSSLCCAVCVVFSPYLYRCYYCPLCLLFC